MFFIKGALFSFGEEIRPQKFNIYNINDDTMTQTQIYTFESRSFKKKKKKISQYSTFTSD